MTSGVCHQRLLQTCSLDMGTIEWAINWEDVICPICLDFPHNGILLLCSSYGKGCRPFMCDTDHTHSNCLDRFRTAHGMPSPSKITSTTDRTSIGIQEIESDENIKPTCPLCRGNVTGWLVVDEVRDHLNMKKRSCEAQNCQYVANYMDLQKHTNIMHPDARPAEIDPVRKLDWENFEQSSEIIDVLSTIHSEVPHGVVLGDYVIEYGDDEDTGDESGDYPRVEGNWWKSCVLYKVFENFRASTIRRRARRAHRRLIHDAPSVDESSTSSIDIAELRFDETVDELVGVGVAAAAVRRTSTHRSSWRHRRHFQNS